MRVGEDGKKHACFYPRLYESYRDGDGKVRQRYLLPLDLSDLPSWKDRYAMCHVLNDLVANGPSLNLDDTPVTHKAWEVYGQLTAKGLLGDAAKMEEMKRRERSSVLIGDSLKNVMPRQVGAEAVCPETPEVGRVSPLQGMGQGACQPCPDPNCRACNLPVF